MTNSNEKYQSWHEPRSGGTEPSINWSDLGAGAWFRLVGVYFAKIVCAFAWGASFQTVNPMVQGVFLADLLPLPLPVGLQDLSASILINITLGILAVTLPSVLWHYALKHDVLHHPRDYFEANPLRIVVCSLLLTGYGLTISLEVMSLMNRIDGSLNTGPIPILGLQPELLPLAVASAALVLGSCLLGLASASLSRSIHARYAS